MIKLQASASNQYVIQPTASFADGSDYIVKFVDKFSKDEFLAQATGSSKDRWIRLNTELSSGSYTINRNVSQVPLKGGSFDVQIFDGKDIGVEWDTEDQNWELANFNWDTFTTISVYASESRKWSVIGSTWSNVPGLPQTIGSSIVTTQAFVSESYSRDQYVSTNENGAYVVYEG